MSDEQPASEQPAGPAPSAPPAGDRWGDPIPPERQAELKALADQQRAWAAASDHQGRESYFAGVRLTGAEVFWLAAYALAGPAGDVAAAQEWLRTGRDRDECVNLSALHLERADLSGAHLEGASVGGPNREQDYYRAADLPVPKFGPADLEGAHLEGAILNEAHLEGDDLFAAHLEGADLRGAYLEGARLEKAHLEGAILSEAYLEGATLSEAYLEWAYLGRARLERAFLAGAHLEGAALGEAHLEGAFLFAAHLEGKTYAPGDADLTRIRQRDADFPATLPPADLRLAFLNTATILNYIHLGDAKGGTVQVADVRWGGVNLAVVDWTPFTDRKAVLGDEQAARDWKPEPFTETEDQRKRSRQERARARVAHATQQNREQLAAFQAAVRANRQLATVLRDQGMNEEADHFAYRAQVLQRRVFHLQGKGGRQLLSWFLDVVAGYGYRPLRSVIAYVVIIGAFAGAYLLNGQFATPHLRWDEALVLSISSFHGRGFFNSGINLGDTFARLAAGEAIIGLLIEISFIATFTQRFFGAR